MDEPSRENSRLVEDYIARWASGDIAGLLELFSPDIQYHDMTSGAVVHHKDLQQFLTETFAREGDGSLEFNSIIYPNEGSVLLHWTQTLPTRPGRHATKVHGVELIVLERGKIESIYEFYDYREGDGEAADGDEQDVQISKLGLREDQLEIYAERINNYFAAEQAFLQPGINLAAVAEAVGLKRNQTSFVINRVIGCSFYDYVNKNRIDYVIERMGEPGSSISIVNLAIDAGFNTLSGFYTAFKKHTGKTPSAYRKDVLDGR